MGRLVFDNLKKVILYLMPVWLPFTIIILRIPRDMGIGRHVHGIHHRIRQRLPWNAIGSQLVPASVLLHHE